MQQNLSDSLQALRAAFGRDAMERAQNGARIIPVHEAVPGRLRLYIAGLKGAELLRRELESHLRRSGLIDLVAASAVTGTVLVIFPTSRQRIEIIACIEAMLSSAEVDVSNLASGKRSIDAPTRSAARQPLSPPWHTLAADEVLKFLGTTRRGLAGETAAGRLVSVGSNTLPTAQPRSGLAIFFEQFKTLPVALLGASATFSVATGGLVEAIAIAAVVVANAVIGYLTESHAERTINALTGGSRRPVITLRDGVPRSLNPAQLVPGDIVLLSPGSQVEADARLLESRHLTVDESTLTGESFPAAKHARGVPDAKAPLADQFNMVRMGTGVTSGSGLAVVVATGLNTEIGRVQSLLGETRAPETPMQRQLDHLGRQLVWFSAGICAAVCGIGVFRQLGLLPMLRASVSLAVAAIPEGLPTVATTTLAIGIRSMRRHNVAVRTLDAIETLGAVQVMCMDKTGTLTVNRMSVLEVYVGMRRLQARDGRLADSGKLVSAGSARDLERLLRVCVLCNETEVNGGRDAPTLNGSATEAALVRLAMDAGLSCEQERSRYPRLETEYRGPSRNYMRTVHEAGSGARMFAVKGAPAEVLELCRWYAIDDRIEPLEPATRAAILAENDRMASRALRVLGFASSRDGAAADAELVWLGLVGLADPIRNGIVDLIEQFHRAGIRTAMVTGDQRATAHAIGEQLRLSGTDELEILDAMQLERRGARALGASARNVDIFSRVSPVHKLQVVQALQAGECVVAMTGDGVNDAPALRAADIGVAMGKSGTDLARSVADIVLEDDNLQTMMTAISEGRTSYDNIRKSVHFLVSSNLSEIGLTLVSVATGLGLPLTPMQLLWINLMTDVLPAVALAAEPPEPDVLQRPPRDPARRIIEREDLTRYGVESGLLMSAALSSYGYGRLRYGAGAHANTIAFMSLGLAQLAHTYTCRSDRHGLFGGELAKNRWLDAAVGGSSIAHVLTAILPPLRAVLGTAPLRALDFAVSALAAAVPYVINEALKKSRDEDETKGSGSRSDQSIAPIKAAAER